MARRWEEDVGPGMGIVEEGPLFVQVRRQGRPENQRQGHRGEGFPSRFAEGSARMARRRILPEGIRSPRLHDEHRLP